MILYGHSTCDGTEGRISHSGIRAVTYHSWRISYRNQAVLTVQSMCKLSCAPFAKRKGVGRLVQKLYFIVLLIEYTVFTKKCYY